MDILDRDSLNSLAQPSGWPSVSVYMPTHQMPRATDQDRIRLKNLLKRACEKLVEQGMREADAESLCAPLRSMLDSDEAWRDVSNGLAAFISTEGMRVLRVDMPMPEQVAVGDRFYLRPLLTAFHEDESFFALALDKNGTRLFRGDRGAYELLSLGDAPATFEEAMKYEDAEKNLTHASFAPGRPSSRHAQHGGSTYAGYGGEKDVAIEQTTRFARLIERGVSSAVGTSKAPLVLLGVERLVSAYREVNTYGHVADEQVLGATDYLPDAEIVSLARNALAPVFASRIEADLSELAENEGSSLTSHDPSDIVAAAATGRVKTLFFDDSAGPFGTFDRENFEVRQMCSETPKLLRESGDGAGSVGDGECGWDLIDLAAAETALHAGRLHAFSGEDPPVRGVAALYRY